MRCKTPLPPTVKCFPEYLREAGYFCTNNVKTDYQFDVPKGVWDENSAKAHWRHRAAGQPFFAVFNFVVTHESQARATPEHHAKNTQRLKPEDRHDPDHAPLPPYYPDTPSVRRNIANHFDDMTAMDLAAGDLLRELDEAGVADETIVFFFSDHGRGLPRGKRWLYDSGTRVPLLIRWPGKLAPGTVRDELVAFVDMAPTVLSLVGLEIPAYVQGQAFLGPRAAPPREYVYAARDRMDERFDIIRAVRDHRYKYIRNYEPWKPYAQHVSYGDEMETMQDWRRLAAEGKLVGPQKLFMAPTKPLEELYDCETDPHEINNLVHDSGQHANLERLRAEHMRWMRATHDLAFVPEPIQRAWMARTGGDDWRDVWARHELRSQLHDVIALFEPPQDHRSVNPYDALCTLLGDSEPAVRYWAIVGLYRPGPGVDARLNSRRFEPLLKDEEPAVRIAAAAAIARFGKVDSALPVLIAALDDPEPSVRHAATLVLDDLGPAASPALSKLRQIAAGKTEYDVRVAHHILEQPWVKKASE
jgi:uncharacterized sulfatase